MELTDRVTPYPFYEPATPWITILIYLATIFLLHAWMKNRKAFEMRTLLGLHNLLLCVFSFYMTVGLGFRLIQVVQKGGLFGVYCGTSEYDMDKLLYWCDLFYLSKYYELLDTVFVVLRKKQLTLLHVWHHSAVVFVCWIATMDRIVMGWITVMDNTTVHTFMYYYYAMQSLQRREVWWRKYLTTMQIIQFFIDMVTSVFFIYFYWIGVPCRGTLRSWLIANFTGFSFFVLFIQFYLQQYKKPSPGSTSVSKKAS